jgi:hypothetical protein
MARSSGSFTTIHSEGALLPPDLLSRIQSGDRTLPGLTPEAYHLPGTMRLNEAASRAWNALLGAWETFVEARERLPEDDVGTTLTRERWLLPLFQELGYGRLQTQTAREMGGKSYALSHAYGHAPIHLVGCKIHLDTRTRGVAGAATGSPHSLLQEFLNRSDENLWGIVSNGLRLRVMRDNLALTRQAYLEFDLHAMMEGETYSDFVLLFLLLHQSRLESERPQDSVLEKWSEEVARTGTRVLEDLSLGVEKAIETLGQGFLEHPGNDQLRQDLRSGELTGQDYYRQLLRLVYRLLFLFVAEDRDALHPPGTSDQVRERYYHYSTGRLRRVADDLRGGRHTDSYEILKVVFHSLGHRGEVALGLPALGSFLFSVSATRHLATASLPNAYLYRAIRALAYAEVDQIRRPVDYKNLGSEELGGVYESLLELHPEIDTSTRTFKLITAAGNERKTTGSYYTPSSLISLLLDSALDPVLEDKVSGKSKAEAEAAVLNMKVVDPACGSGHFLIAAAQRIAKRLAAVRTGDDEPSPDEIRKALRDVAGRCLYGVDVNEMSAELCKVALWMEALEPGRPLSFLEHRIQAGNSLLGTTRKLITSGIPDDAYKPIEGDDKRIANDIKKQNREERRGQAHLFDADPTLLQPYLARAFHDLEQMPADTPEQLQVKERTYQALMRDQNYRQEKLLADAWTAAFVWPLTDKSPRAPTTATLRSLQDGHALAEGRQAQLSQLAYDYRFFHWHVAYPEVFPPEGKGGFDVVLGNPPWERVKLQEQEWFAVRAPEIAQLRKQKRQQLIRELERTDDPVFRAFVTDRRRADGASHLARNSGRFPLTGRGDVNTYPLFAELGRSVLASGGRLGMILPSGIATDATTQYFFQDLVETRSLASLYDFENRRAIFPGVHRSYKFCLLSLTGHGLSVEAANFAFFLLDPADLRNPETRFTLTPEDIALLNPNTKTLPIFRSRRDAEITTSIYRRIPVLVNEATGDNPWGISFSTMFHMSSDSGLFHTREQLETDGLKLQGNRFVGEGMEYLPLYEAKMFHQFDHRFATHAPDGTTRDVTAVEHGDHQFVPMPRYWVESSHVDERLSGKTTAVQGSGFTLAYRNIARSTDERTAIFSILPRTAAGDPAPLIWPADPHLALAPVLIACLNSFALDFVARQKVGGTHLSFFYLKQFPVPRPEQLTAEIVEQTLPRAVELIFTANDLNDAARGNTWANGPCPWNEDRRFHLRTELDAIFFHLYGLERDEVEYVMETFPIVKRKDEAEHGHYRTKQAILAAYDEIAST